MKTYFQPHLYGPFQFITQDLKPAYGVANNTAIQKLQYKGFCISQRNVNIKLNILNETQL